MTERAELDLLLSRIDVEVRKAFEAAIRNQAGRINLVALADALRRGDIAAAQEIAAIKPRDVARIGEVLRNAFFAAADLAGRGGRGVVGLFQFDGRRPEALAWAEQNSARLITRLTEESRDAVRETITGGLDLNRSAQSVARDIAGRRVGAARVGSIVGLTGPQAASIARARVGLSSGNPAAMRDYLKLALRDRKFDRLVRLSSGNPAAMRDYLKLALRDRKFDRLVLRAIKEGRPISRADLDRMLEAHKVKALRYRAKVIAQAETFKAAAAGRDQAYRQMLEMDGVTGVTVRWQHNLSAEPRVEHIAMGGTVLPIGQPFVFPDETAMLHPHDDTAPARHVIGCKCIAVYRVQVEKG